MCLGGCKSVTEEGMPCARRGRVGSKDVQDWEDLNFVSQGRGMMEFVPEGGKGGEKGRSERQVTFMVLS